MNKGKPMELNMMGKKQKGLFVAVLWPWNLEMRLKRWRWMWIELSMSNLVMLWICMCCVSRDHQTNPCLLLLFVCWFSCLGLWNGIPPLLAMYLTHEGIGRFFFFFSAYFSKRKNCSYFILCDGTKWKGHCISYYVRISHIVF